jgi:hypothetical protein
MAVILDRGITTQIPNKPRGHDVSDGIEALQRAIPVYWQFGPLDYGEGDFRAAEPWEIPSLPERSPAENYRALFFSGLTRTHHTIKSYFVDQRIG